MRRVLLNLLFFILCIVPSYAQDTLFMQRDSSTFLQTVKEISSPITYLTDAFYGSAGLRHLQRQHAYAKLSAQCFYADQDRYFQQLGKGTKGLRVSAESYVKNTSTSTLWGKASYTNEKKRAVNFNETNDYAVVYPYVMLDSIGGDLPTETYQFSGGFNKQLAAFNYGITGSFKGVQAYRSRDPRPKNISSDVALGFAISKTLNSTHLIAFDIDGCKYGQNNQLSFANPLGTPPIYQDAGLGGYNQLLARTIGKAIYDGLSWSARLSISPFHKKGFSGFVSYKRFALDKTIENANAPIGSLTDQQLYAVFGYINQGNHNDLVIKATLQHNKREGIEAIFERGTTISYLKISEINSFNHQQTTLTLQSTYGKKKDNFDWYIGANLGYQDSQTQYTASFRAMNFRRLQAEGYFVLVKPINKSLFNAQLNLAHQHPFQSYSSFAMVDSQSGIYSMLQQNYAYLSSSVTTLSVQLKGSTPLSNKLGGFIELFGVYSAYQHPFNGYQGAVTCGIIF